jgi:acetolactate decarboxylase
MAKVSNHTLYQVSTATALVEEIYQGAVRIGTLRKHGNLGLGTFENLDGEILIVDGHVFQVKSDGSVREAQDEASSPFAAVVYFTPESGAIDHCPDLAHLIGSFDALRNSCNVFFALRVDGTFDYIHTRAMCRNQVNLCLQVTRHDSAFCPPVSTSPYSFQPNCREARQPPRTLHRLKSGCNQHGEALLDEQGD